MRWFVVGKYKETFRLRYAFDNNGSEIYCREGAEPVEWWIFREVERGKEVIGGPLPHGIACGLFYPDRLEHVLACIYSLRPWRDYPRFYTVELDDLPEIVRMGCRYESDGRENERLIFPPWDRLPDEFQPVYTALAVQGPGDTMPGEVVKKLIEYEIENYAPKHE